MDKISVVVPIYGCRKSLNELYERLTKEVSKITKDYEFLFVNDNCPQNSWEIIEKICKKDKKVKGINLSKNYGQMKAILAGLDNVSGDYVVVMDCDLQDRPEEIINLYTKIKEGYDYVIARRKERKDSKPKIFISKLFYKMYSFATNADYDPSLCNFSICKRSIIDNYCKIREEHRAYVMYLKWMGFNGTVLDIEHDERKYGKSSYNFKKRMKLALDILFSQSDKLLRLIVSFGMILSLLSFIAIIVILILHFAINLKAGWASTILCTILMGGMNIFVLGIVGIYVGNIFVQVKQRPLYFIKDYLNKECDKDDTF